MNKTLLPGITAETHVFIVRTIDDRPVCEISFGRCLMCVLFDPQNPEAIQDLAGEELHFWIRSDVDLDEQWWSVIDNYTRSTDLISVTVHHSNRKAGL